ncbi:MAG: hypothetical protein KDA85_13210 [Planctomycetaceae bacterium]|nr:hypothetical protein [Planctomycetaceae bacterium]
MKRSFLIGAVALIAVAGVLRISTSLINAPPSRHSSSSPAVSRQDLQPARMVASPVAYQDEGSADSASYGGAGGSYEGSGFGAGYGDEASGGLGPGTGMSMGMGMGMGPAPGMGGYGMGSADMYGGDMGGMMSDGAPSRLSQLQSQWKKSRNEQQRAELRKQVIKELNKSFDADMAFRKHQMEQIERRLENLRQLYARREAARERIVGTRADALTMDWDGLGFPATAYPGYSLAPGYPGGEMDDGYGGGYPGGVGYPGGEYGAPGMGYGGEVGYEGGGGAYGSGPAEAVEDSNPAEPDDTKPSSGLEGTSDEQSGTAPINTAPFAEEATQSGTSNPFPIPSP